MKLYVEYEKYKNKFPIIRNYNAEECNLNCASNKRKDLIKIIRCTIDYIRSTVESEEEIEIMIPECIFETAAIKAGILEKDVSVNFCIIRYIMISVFKDEVTPLFDKFNDQILYKILAGKNRTYTYKIESIVGDTIFATLKATIIDQLTGMDDIISYIVSSGIVKNADYISSISLINKDILNNAPLYEFKISCIFERLKNDNNEDMYELLVANTMISKYLKPLNIYILTNSKNLLDSLNNNKIVHLDIYPDKHISHWAE